MVRNNNSESGLARVDEELGFTRELKRLAIRLLPSIKYYWPALTLWLGSSVAIMAVLQSLHLKFPLDLYILGGISFFILFILIIYKDDIVRPLSFPSYENFRPLRTDYTSKADFAHRINRDNDESGIYSMINGPTDPRFFFVMGPSGVGKSTIVGWVSAKLANEGWVILKPIRGFSNLVDLSSSLEMRCRNQNISFEHVEGHLPRFKGNFDDKRILVVFDQFEQFLDRTRSRSEDRRKFEDFLSQVQKVSAITLLFVVRDEFFYHLIRLSTSFNIVPHTIQIDPIDPAMTNIDDSSVAKVLLSVAPIAMREELEGALRRESWILPVEFQMMGLMLEDLEYGPSFITKRIRNNLYVPSQVDRRSLVRRYFMRAIYSCGDVDTAKAVLFALASGGGLRKKINLRNTAIITQRSEKTIEVTLKTLLKSGLVIEDKEEGCFFFAHDYLSQEYYALASDIIESAERENIDFFSQNLSTARPKSREQKRGTYFVVNSVFVLLSLSLVARLLVPTIGIDFVGFHWLESFVKAALNSHNAIIELDYLAAFLSSSICLLYVWQLYTNLFSYIHSRSWITNLVIATSIICIFSGEFVPHAWLMLATLAGFAVAAGSLIHVKLSTRKRSPLLRRFYRATGGLMLVGMLFGLAQYRLFYHTDPSTIPGGGLVLSELLFCALFFLFIANCYSHQATSEKAPVFLASWFRLNVK